ncbi:MAG: redoxin domain-containing protein, partial [Planctomycetota bacterium]
MTRVLLLALGLQLGLMGDARVAAEPVEAFRLPRAADDQSLDVSPGKSDVTVVCFLSTECPVARLYASRLGKLSAELTGRGVRFVGVSSNRQDSRDDVVAFATHYGIPFEIGLDYRNVLADRFHVQRVPEVFVLDRDLVIRYRGRVDDQYDPGQARAEPQQHYLLDAIHDVLAGRPVTLASTQATGCLLGRVREPVVTSDVTYANQIARLFQQHCIECHREGEIGPFSLTEYEEALGWGEMILEVVENGRMPPWHADPAVGHFINERHLSKEEIANLHKWVENGMPFGDPKQLPEKQVFTSGWRLSAAPDLVLSMSDHAFEIPAEGTVDYQYFVVDPDFEEDRWVTQVEVRPGNASVLHHSLVFIRPPDGEEFRGIGWLAGYVPGQRPAQFPPGSAIRIPAGSKLVFQQHYTPSGKPQQDITQVALRFATPEEVSHEVYCLLGMNQSFESPPQAADHVVHSSVQRLPKRASLLSIMPHM